MRILALDTACMTATCAVAEDGALLAESALHGTLTHSRKLLPMVSAMLESLSMKPSDMDAFAVSIGPGSFTGLRIGVVTAKGLAFATGKPCFGIPTLQALAMTVPWFNGVICPVLDARNSHAFCGFYERRPYEAFPLAEDTVLHVDDLSDRLLSLNRDILLIGDAAQRFHEIMQVRWRNMGVNSSVHAADPVLFGPRAATTARLALKRLEAGDAGDASSLAPQYLRQSQAERYKHRDP